MCVKQKLLCITFQVLSDTSSSYNDTYEVFPAHNDIELPYFDEKDWRKKKFWWKQITDLLVKL